MDKTKTRVFVSYSRKDASIVREIVNALKEQGLTVWSDDSHTAGTDWATDIEKALRQTDAFIFVISPESLESPSVNFELGVALSRSADSPDLRIIPVMVKKVDQKALPPLLRNKEVVKAERKRPDKVASELIKALEN